MSGTEPAEAEDGLAAMVRVCARAPRAWGRCRWGLSRVFGRRRACGAGTGESRALSCAEQAAFIRPSPRQVGAPRGLLGFSRGLTIASLPRALLLPWAQRGLGAEPLAAVAQPGKCSGLSRARDLFCPLPHNLGNETLLPVLLHLNCLNCQFFGTGIIHP